MESLFFTLLHLGACPIHLAEVLATEILLLLFVTVKQSGREVRDAAKK